MVCDYCYYLDQESYRSISLREILSKGFISVILLSQESNPS